MSSGERQTAERGAEPSPGGRLIGLDAGRDHPFTTQLFGSHELTLVLAITDAAALTLRKRALSMALLTDLAARAAAAALFVSIETAAVNNRQARYLGQVSAQAL